MHLTILTKYVSFGHFIPFIKIVVIHALHLSEHASEDSDLKFTFILEIIVNIFYSKENIPK